MIGVFYVCLLIFSSGITYLKADCVPSETTVSGSYVKSDPICAGELLFDENFDNFNLEVWKHENTLSGGGNWEFQYYTNNRSNSYVENGHLHIRPTLLSDEHEEEFLSSGTLDVNGVLPVDHCTDARFYGCVRVGTPIHYLNSIKSAKITTVESFAFKYGRIIIRAKMPEGDWLWPAIWMMPRYNFYGTWPASGEIDIVEARGNKNLLNPNGLNIGTQQISSTLHWGPSPQVNQWPRTHRSQKNRLGYNTDFHEYEFQWTSSNITMLIDGKVISVFAPPEKGFWKLGKFDTFGIDNPWKAGSKMAPFDQKFYLIINLAVGGVSFFGDDNINPGGKPWTNNSTTAYRDFWKGRDQWLPTWNFQTDDTHLIVDYVKVYSV